MAEWAAYIFEEIKQNDWKPEYSLWVKTSLTMYEKQGLPYGRKLKDYYAWREDRGLINEEK